MGGVVNLHLHINLPADVEAKFVGLLTQILAQGTKIVASIQELEQKFTDYIAKRDDIDAAKDAASAAKDATIADLTSQLAAAAAAAGTDPATIKALQDGINDAFAKEQAALDALTPPVAPPADPGTVGTVGTV